MTLMLKPSKQRESSTYRAGFFVLVGTLLPLTGSCVKTSTESDVMTESQIVKLQSSCGETRTFLFAHSVQNLKGQTSKDWSCWYAASSPRVFGQPTDDELKKMFAASKPVVWKYINSNTLTKRLADIDKQRTSILWLGTGLALVGCGVAAAGSGGLALAACALFGSAPASYDVFGGDPSQGAAEAWKKMADMSDKEIVQLECNAVNTIIEQARFIDRGALTGREGASTSPCPSAKKLFGQSSGITGIQAGAHEVKSKPVQNQNTKP